ncbi:MAG: porphobilinogen synthase [Proteobacteria bacterium]|nr:porphobilinogen synthase [Pseudomonadota bacterium]
MRAPSPLDLPRRPRRNRKAEWTRRLVRETRLSTDDLIWPVFLHAGEAPTETIASMPGVLRYSVKAAVEAAREAKALGIPALALFPNTPGHLRDERGTEALNPDNLICRALRAIKDAVPEIGLIGDIALDPYTSHGHDGVLKDGRILNDESVAILVEQSLVQAAAGADILGPSDMMDGRIGAIRAALDAEGREECSIMAYSAKYASCHYGPFRDAVGSSSTLSGDKKTYQMDFANAAEALIEAELDIAEGADMIMVKPGMPYLDILYRLKSTLAVPTYIYQVSGEYAMIMAAAERGMIDAEKAMVETLSAFKRAGADGILTYFAPRMARHLADHG